MPDDSWGPIYEDAAQQYGLSPNLLRSVVSTESGGNPNAVSPKGAVGPAQIMPATAKALGVTDPTDPAQSIYGAAKLLRENYDRYGSPELAVLAYHGGTDPANWGPKTQDYLGKVSAAYSQYSGAPAADAAQPSPESEPAAPPPLSIKDKIEAARKAGYSDQDIAGYLQKSPTFAEKFETARAAGYKDDEIFGHLGLALKPPETAKGEPGLGSILLSGLEKGIGENVKAAKQAAELATGKPIDTTQTPEDETSRLDALKVFVAADPQVNPPRRCVHTAKAKATEFEVWRAKYREAGR